VTDAQQQLVERALRAAFGTATYDDATPVAGGMSSALILRMVVAGRAYLVRVGGSPHADAATEMANVRSAAEAGLAPKVWYASIEDRTMITDFIERRPFSSNAGVQIAALISRLQTLPPYARVLHQLDFTTGMIERYREAKLGGGAADVLAGFAEVAAGYPRDAAVACHNDLKAANIVFDGVRPWFVDWEAAFSNDRYADLANSASFFCTDADRFLSAYLGAPAEPVHHARFFLMRFAVHVSYVAFVGLLAARGGAGPQPTPGFRAFHDGLIDGSIDLLSPERKQEYANVHLAAARELLESSRFAASLAQVA
jgi:aminoglycoside phosphotransferase (APT) family kinase protein